MKVKAQMGSSFSTVTRSELKKRFDRCAKLSALVASAKCALDHTANLLDAGARGRNAIVKGLDEAHKIALAMKGEFWTPDDRTPYIIEKGTRDMAARIGKATKSGRIDDKTAAKVAQSVRTLLPKVDDLWNKRSHWECGVKDYEDVEKSK